MNKNYKKIFYIISISLVILRLIFIGNTFLIDDEAYYAMYARHLSWGYIDHGPVIGYLIYLFTIIGENSFTVRLSSLVLLIILTVVLYNFGKQHFNQNTGIIMSLGISANMLFHTNSVVVTPDVPLAFFSIMAILFYYKAYFIHENYFYIGGLFLGLAILSKVSALFPAIGIMLFPFINSSKRYILYDIRFYGSLLIALILFMPFIIWNLQNDLAFVRYQGSHITEGGNLSDFAALWAGLFVTAG
ncbi:MAG: glycosyltransferase family 39 protein, partial [Candidatus Marinimicrobia bacterium]|nr:glycosyltransferase family 39 protein [Candidatus Neomarinimicrobiota bacterium]